jgi:hypothetical protein
MTNTILPMLDTYPLEIRLDRQNLADTIDKLLACSQACTACADACLSERSVAELAKCIRTNLDCADICATASRVLSRHTGYDASVVGALLLACITVCEFCSEECIRHAQQHEHCRVCAEACAACAAACSALLIAIDGQGNR